MEKEAYLKNSHSQGIYVGGFGRKFRREVFRESKPVRVHHFRRTPSDGVPSVSDLIISLDACGRLRLILQSVIVDDPCSTKASQSSAQVRIYEDVRLRR